MFARLNRGDEPRELFVVRNARAHLADLVFDLDLQRARLGRKDLFHLRELHLVVDADAHVDAAMQALEALIFVLADDLVGDENITDAVIRHDLRFADLGAGDAARAGFHLELCKVRHPMRFDVRPQL